MDYFASDDCARWGARGLVLTSCTSQSVTTTAPYLDPPVIPDPVDGLEAILDQVIVRDGAGVVMIALIDPTGATFVERGADPTGRHLAPDTPMWIAGVGAMFAELTTLVLADEGEIDLDVGVNRYLDASGCPMRSRSPIWSSTRVASPTMR